MHDVYHHPLFHLSIHPHPFIHQNSLKSAVLAWRIILKFTQLNVSFCCRLRWVRAGKCSVSAPWINKSWVMCLCWCDRARNLLADAILVEVRKWRASTGFFHHPHTLWSATLLQFLTTHTSIYGVLWLKWRPTIHLFLSFSGQGSSGQLPTALSVCFIGNTDSTIPPAQSKQWVRQCCNNAHISLCRSSLAGGV